MPLPPLQLVIGKEKRQAQGSRYFAATTVSKMLIINTISKHSISCKVFFNVVFTIQLKGKYICSCFILIMLKNYFIIQILVIQGE